MGPWNRSLPIFEVMRAGAATRGTWAVLAGPWLVSTLAPFTKRTTKKRILFAVHYGVPIIDLLGLRASHLF